MYILSKLRYIFNFNKFGLTKVVPIRYGPKLNSGILPNTAFGTEFNLCKAIRTFFYMYLNILSIVQFSDVWALSISEPTFLWSSKYLKRKTSHWSKVLNQTIWDISPKNTHIF